MNYLQIFETTHVATILRPFSSGSRRELLTQPKVYGFDTGFVCFSRGWRDITDNNKGLLWEHVVLETLQSFPQGLQLHFWRDKSQREIDFVVNERGEEAHAIECKWNPTNIEVKNFLAFRNLYPKGRNFVVHPENTSSYAREIDGVLMEVVSLPTLKQTLLG
jgi:predicted AAA+ superfamily ATPase